MYQGLQAPQIYFLLGETPQKNGEQTTQEKYRLSFFGELPKQIPMIFIDLGSLQAAPHLALSTISTNSPRFER